MTITQQLLAEVEAFMARHDMPYTRFGELACRDRNAVSRLRKGYGLTTRRYEQMKNFMRDYRDEGQKFRPSRRLQGAAA